MVTVAVWVLSSDTTVPLEVKTILQVTLESKLLKMLHSNSKEVTSHKAFINGFPSTPTNRGKDTHTHTHTHTYRERERERERWWRLARAPLIPLFRSDSCHSGSASHDAPCIVKWVTGPSLAVWMDSRNSAGTSCFSFFVFTENSHCFGRTWLRSRLTAYKSETKTEPNVTYTMSPNLYHSACLPPPLPALVWIRPK